MGRKTCEVGTPVGPAPKNLTVPLVGRAGEETGKHAAFTRRGSRLWQTRMSYSGSSSGPGSAKAFLTGPSFQLPPSLYV